MKEDTLNRYSLDSNLRLFIVLSKTTNFACVAPKFIILGVLLLDE
jgi:hypothetical protein